DEHMTALKTAMEGDDAADIKAKMDALQQASMKLGEAMYKASQEAGPDAAAADGDAGDSAGGDDGSAASDDVVDADFEEVDDQNRDNKSA
ncbi:MAG: molecular chaperone DnaK, partial [Nisaea sp.]